MGRRYLKLGRLADMSVEELAAEWAYRYGSPAPKLSPELLRLGLGYKLQEERLGGISRLTRSLLQQASAYKAQANSNAPVPRKLLPGSRLVRDWHGVGHTVTVLEVGYEFDGRRWKSLSSIAKAITGSHWNGPKFFGLRETKK